MKLANGTSVHAGNQIPKEMTVPVSHLQFLQKHAAIMVKQQP